MVSAGLIAILLGMVAMEVNGHRHPGFLVKMEKKEFIDLLTCVGKSKDYYLCSNFADCEKLMHTRVLYAFEECKKEVVPEDIKKCPPYSVVYEKPEVPEKIYECVVKKVEKLSYSEKKEMGKFEDCAKKLLEEDCKEKKY